MVYLIKNLKYHVLFQHFLQYLHLFLCIKWNCRYLYNTVFLFYHILVYHNHTKTHTLIFYLILVLKVLNRQVKFISIRGFFSQQFLLDFLWKILEYNNLVLKANSFFFFLLWKSLISACYLIVSIVLQKTALFISLKKSLSKSFFWFLLNLSSYQYIILAKGFD